MTIAEESPDCGSISESVEKLFAGFCEEPAMLWIINLIRSHADIADALALCCLLRLFCNNRFFNPRQITYHNCKYNVFDT